MSDEPRCDWCHGACLVTLWHRDYEGNVAMTAEVVNHRTGQIYTRRVPGRITIHCRECPEGERRYQCFDAEPRAKLWTTRHMGTLTECYGYITTDPTYRSIFKSEEEAICWAASLGDAAAALPPLPRAVRTTPARLSDQIRQRAGEESATSPPTRAQIDAMFGRIS